MASTAPTPSTGQPVVGLIMTGGGARAAYQVGVLRALYEIVPRGVRNPFPIICGTSAGAINAAVLATDAANFRRGVRRLMTVWKNFHVHHVYRADAWGAFGNSARWILAAIAGGRLAGEAISLLDNAPLARLLERHVDFPAIGRCVEAGHLKAFAVTCSGYTSGQSVTFYEGHASLAGWERARRVGVAMPIRLPHLMASSALPFIFPPVKINREYFGDGSMRQVAPVSPALHLGADRLLVIGVGRQSRQSAVRVQGEGYPSLAQIAGHALDSIFLDGLEVDLERLQRINRTLAIIPRETLEKNGYPLRAVDYRVLTPSVPLSQIATLHAHELPRVIRTLLRTVGATRRTGSNLLSYVLFEKAYCRALIRLGYDDAMAQAGDLRDFLCGGPG
ncbi:MAG: patatin-like phospholipase family protein [Burkholderiales bacterium]